MGSRELLVERNTSLRRLELAKDAERAERRHAERRDRAQVAIEKASGELARIQLARVANSDAKVLTRYLGALGLEVEPDRLNDWLVLLAVIMVEVGGGLSLAIGMAPVRAARRRYSGSGAHRVRRARTAENKASACSGRRGGRCVRSG
jgi:hypothetical protein